MRNTMHNYAGEYNLPNIDRYATIRVTMPLTAYFPTGPFGPDSRVVSYCDFWRHVIVTRKIQIRNCFGCRRVLGFDVEHVSNMVRAVRFAEKRLANYK